MSIVVGENLICDAATLNNFDHLLSCAKEKLLKNSTHIAKCDFWKAFEMEVHRALVASKNDVGLAHWKIEYIGGHKFPDIVARINEKEALGIEIKTISTRNKSWKIMGGSIMESTRIPDVSRIHVFCAKQQPFEIKYRSFEECVEDVAVTHSPRYMLDMNVDHNNSLFTKLGKTYDEIRQMPNPFEAFKDYMIASRNQRNSDNEDTGLWWFSPKAEEFSNQDLAEEKFASTLVNINVKFWKDLPQNEKEQIKVEMLVASPSIVEGKYEFACQWLLQRKGIVCPSFRDNFSAGGQVNVYGVRVPKIIGKIFEWKLKIAETFNAKEFSLESFYYWEERLNSISKFSESEKKVLQRILKEIEVKIKN